MLNLKSLKRYNFEALKRGNAPRASMVQRFNASTVHASRITHHASAFTLIELILVMSLLVIITSIATPAMSRFIRGQALVNEARRLSSLLHLAQSRAVSEGMPMMFWVDEKTGTYGVAADNSTSQTADPKAETLTLASSLDLSVVTTGISGLPTTFNSLPAIRFQADGTVDESSPQTLKLMDSDGFARWFIETRLRTGYDVTDTPPAGQ